ncbi:MAG: hypothetical protein SW833_07460 [Cyanobacteriota bacterium]|nr:hypothetical protein [Cyanobacteriota bacterium]
MYRLGENGYEPIDRNELPGLVDLDLNFSKQCILLAETNAMEAVK